MMKKLWMMFFCLFTLQTVAIAKEGTPIQTKQLPKQAQTFIQTHFAHQRVALVTMERDWFDKNYEVTFANGDKLEFNKKGNWVEVNCKQGEVPVAVVPDAIRSYVSTHYPETSIQSIEKDKRNYEVTLSIGLEILFDANYRVIRLDH